MSYEALCIHLLACAGLEHSSASKGGA